MNQIFDFSAVTLIAAILISLVGLIVTCFTWNFMNGDRYYKRTLLQIVLLWVSAGTMVVLNHFLFFLIGWVISNFLLVNLMAYKFSWGAARAAAMIAGKRFVLSSGFLACSFVLLYLQAGSSLISEVIVFKFENGFIFKLTLGFLVLAAMLQSGIWPFHKWLLSSLNSPTPVCAIMHGGIIILGIFIIIRFGPLFSNEPLFLGTIFGLGVVTIILGTVWKMLQSDRKRMLACSTMAQMGLAFALCGLELFSLVLLVICWHGVYKTYLFLISGSVVEEKQKKHKVLIKSKILDHAYVMALNASQPASSTITTHRNYYDYN